MQPATGVQYELTRDDQRAVVTEVGATLRCWTVRGRDRLDGFAAGEPGQDYQGKVLMPWPNRIAGGRYTFAGAEQQAALTEPDRGNALHGLATWVNWHAREAGADRVTLAYGLHPQPGYPFTLELEAAYALTADGLELELRAANVGTTAAPFGTGLHPYLRLGESGVDELELELPAATRLTVDENARPLEWVPVAGTEFDLSRPRRLAGLQLDTCFARLDRGGDGIARVGLSARDGERTTLWMDGRFDYVQVFTADDVKNPARRRRSVAIEPMTCAPDAFNSGDGLIVLQPGESFAGRCGLSRD